MKRVIIPVILVLIISLSYIVFSQTVGEFTVGNEAPSISGFEIQDSATTWDSTNLNTHDVNTNFRWKVDDPNPDSLTTSICIGTSLGLCNIIDEIAGTYNQGDTVTYTYTGGNIQLDQATHCSATSCSRDYYITVRVDDGELITSEDYIIEILNQVPDLPSSLTPTQTHDQTPDLSWTATDPDDGTQDKWPQDVLTYHIRVGTAYGLEEYLADPSSATPSSTATNPIPWGTPGETQAITTVYVRIWTTDNIGIDSTNYEITLDLVDNLPEFLNIFLSDSAIVQSDSCVDYLPSQNCYINPLSGDYTSVNAKLTINDIDGDCAALTHSAEVVLCLVDALGPELCDDVNNADYPSSLTFLETNGLNCNFTISIPSGDPAGIEFFKAPGVYKLYANAASQAGSSTTTWNYEWEYVILPAIEYTDSVFLGDRATDGGDGIQLGQWNPGLSLATILNHGNAVLTLDWTGTDPELAGSTAGCDGHTAACWDLSAADELQIDDDNIQGESTETQLTPANIPEDPASIGFNPTGGLNICDNMLCNSGIDETLDTYFHIMPPTGLSPGTYETIFTIIINAI